MRGCSHTMTAKNGGVQTTTLVSQNQKLANHVSPLVKKSKVGSPPLHRGYPFFYWPIFLRSFIDIVSLGAFVTSITTVNNIAALVIAVTK